jgi:hypothetical protein
MSAVESYTATRRQLRGIAESVIAGPQHRASGTIRMAVRPSGFAGVALPLEVHGRELVWPNGAAALARPVAAIADAAGVDFGPPAGVYEIVDPLTPDTVLDIDASSADLLSRCLYAGGHALKKVLPEQHPVLWPEHFDVAVTEDDVNFGVSAGDDGHPLPYAYIGPWTPRSGPFWNAPFGALHPLDVAHDVDELTADIVAFFERGRIELG